MSSVQKLKGRNRWRVRWREGGRGSKAHASRWFDSRAEVLAEQEAIDRRLRALRAPDALMTLPDLVERWALHQRSRRQPRGERYISESARAMLQTVKSNGWVYSHDVQALDLGPGAFRLMKALLRFGQIHHGQTVHARALVTPDRQRAVRKRAPLPTLEDVTHLVRATDEWSKANGFIAHMVAVYGHRPESLVGLTELDIERSHVGHTPAEQSPACAWLTLRVKGGREVRHALLPETIARWDALLAEARQRSTYKPGAPVLVNHLGERWRYGRDFASWFHHCVGKGRGVYRLKCWAITWMWAGGLDVETISSITGHTTDTVRNYLRTNEEKQRDALAIIAQSGALGA